MKLKAEFYDDSKLDDHSERILVVGIKLERFVKNSVLLFMHQQFTYPVGRVLNIRKEGNKLVGEVEFDMADEFAARIAGKYRDGFMNGFSISVRPITKSEDISLLLEGQRHATISESELYEVSCVTIPSHEDALAIRNAFKKNELIKSLYYDSSQEQELAMDLKKLAIRLSLTGKEQLTEESILSAVDTLLERATNAEIQVTELQKVTNEKDTTVKTLEERLANLEEAQKTEKVDLLIRSAVESQKITKVEGDKYKKLALVDYDSVAELLEEKKAYRSINSQLQNSLSTSKQTQFEALKVERAGWKFSDWQKKDSAGLEYARDNDKDFYNSILPKH